MPTVSIKQESWTYNKANAFRHKSIRIAMLTIIQIKRAMFCETYGKKNPNLTTLCLLKWR